LNVLKALLFLFLVIRRELIKTNFAFFFGAKWLSHNFVRRILRNKERGVVEEAASFIYEVISGRFKF